MAVKQISRNNWEASYYVKVDSGRKRFAHKRGFKTKAEAQAYASSMRTVTQPGQFTFSDMFEKMSRSNRASDVTTATRRQRLRDYAPNLMDKPIDRITKESLQIWRKSLSDTNLATNTKNDIIGYVKQVFRFAYEVYDVYDAAKVLKNFPKELEDYHEMQTINYQQFKRLLDQEDDEVMKAFFQLLFMTGCRKGEARALYKEDFDGKQIHIYKSMRRYEDSIKTTKNRQDRYVPLDDATAAMIQKLCQRPGKYIFGDFRPLVLTTIDKKFKADLEAAGLPEIRIHDLRHSHVSLLWAAGVPVPEISKRIGHNSPKVTMERYSHIFDNSQKTSLNVLNNLQ